MTTLRFTALPVQNLLDATLNFDQIEELLKGGLTPSHTFDVTDYGARGDGVTDDSGAIQLAINACKRAGGGVVYFPAGRYLCETSLDVRRTSFVEFRGDGVVSKIIAGAQLDGSDAVLKNDLFNCNNLTVLTANTAVGTNTLTGVTGDQTGVVNGSIVFAGNVPIGAVVTAGLGTGTLTFSGPAATGSGPVSCTVALGVPGSYQSFLRWTDLELDGTLQNAAGVPGSATAGFNLCLIECQNVDYATCDRVRFVNAFGNSWVSASIDPRQAAAVRGSVVGDECTFEGNCRGVMPQYGVTGSVIQFGAMVGGYVGGTYRNNGGPAVDTFNCVGTRGRVYCEGGLATAFGPGQTMNGWHSDFGCEACDIDVISIDAGPVQLSGLRVANAFTIVPTDGPKHCKINARVERTWMFPWATPPAVPASGGSVLGPGQPVALTVTGGSGVSVKFNGLAALGAGPASNQYAVPGFVVQGDVATGSPIISNVQAGAATILNGNPLYGYGIAPGATLASGAGTATWTMSVPATHTKAGQNVGAGAQVTITYTSAPTWSWQICPGIFFPPVGLGSGNFQGASLGSATGNRITATLVDPPADAVYLSDVEGARADVTVSNTGAWQYPSSVFFLHDTQVVAGSGAQNNDLRCHAEDPNGHLFSVVRTDGPGCTGNALTDSWVPVTQYGQAAYLAGISPAQFTARGLRGPGSAFAIAPPTMAASGVITVNPYPYDVDIYVGGGTVSLIELNGTPLPVTSGSFRLLAGQADWIRLTYSAAPTWQWFVAA